MQTVLCGPHLASVQTQRHFSQAVFRDFAEAGVDVVADTVTPVLRRSDQGCAGAEERVDHGLADKAEGSDEARR